MRLSLSRFPLSRAPPLRPPLRGPGRFEIFSRVTTTYQPVTTTADSGPGSLRARIEAAGDGSVVYFASALNGQTITLTSGELAINSSITIEGVRDRVLLTVTRARRLRSVIFHVLPGHTATINRPNDSRVAAASMAPASSTTTPL